MEYIVVLHSLWRWVVLILMGLAILKALLGWFGKQPWQNLDNRIGLFFTSALDLQVLLGIILYIGVLVGVYLPRWYGASLARVSFEHALIMFIALAIVHVVRSRAKKTEGDLAKHRLTAIGYIIALIIIVVSIPTWSFAF
jgi:hypothetical protein